jgi:3-dehydroquinate synthetase
MRERRSAVLARDPATVEEMIRRSLAVKGRIVEKDPRESGDRALLNLGHTFGHALESATGFAAWTHGGAVAWGMGRALAAGVRMGATDPGFAAEVRSLLQAYGFPLSAPVGYNELAAALDRDKKRRGGMVRLVIPREMCDVRVHDVSAADLAEALAEGQEDARDVERTPGERSRENDGHREKHV